MGKLLTQRRYGPASGTTFDYDTKNKTLTSKAAQSKQSSIQSVSLKKYIKIKNACFGDLFIFYGLPTREPSSIICYGKQDDDATKNTVKGEVWKK